MYIGSGNWFGIYKEGMRQIRLSTRLSRVSYNPSYPVEDTPLFYRLLFVVTVVPGR